MDSTTDIFVDQVHKFHNSEFKEYPWKAATVLQKNMDFKNMLWNTECIATFVSSFVKYRTITCIKLPFHYIRPTCSAVNEGSYWFIEISRKLEYQENTDTIVFKFLSPKLSRESCFILWWTIYKRSTKQVTDNFQCRQP